MSQVGQNLDQTALLRAFAGGDRSAARVLTATLGPRVLGYARRMLSGDQAAAEDVTQEVFFRLWRAALTWEDNGTKVSTWAFRVAGNLCIDLLRKSKRGVALDEAPEIEDEAESALAGLVHQDQEKALSQALDQLPARQRQAVVLRHIEGLSNPEIAQIMETGVESVESLTARGRRRLQELLFSRRDALGFYDQTETSHV